MSQILYAILTRSLKHCEGLLTELDSPLAAEAREDVHQARLSVEVMARIERRKHHSVHVLGERGEAA